MEDEISPCVVFARERADTPSGVLAGVCASKDYSEFAFLVESAHLESRMGTTPTMAMQIKIP